MVCFKNTIILSLYFVFYLPKVVTGTEIYGKVNLSLQTSAEGKGVLSEIKSNISRLGLKDSLKLNESINLIYQLEYRVNTALDRLNADIISSGNQYFGFKGSFGELFIGKNDTVLKKSQGKVDLFNGLSGDIKAQWKGENRIANTVTYQSPKINEIQFLTTYIEANGTFSLALFYGDKRLNKTKIFTSIATDLKVNGYNILRITSQAKVASFVLGTMVQRQKKLETGDTMDGFLFSVKYQLAKVVLNSQYQFSDYIRGEINKVASFGVEYKVALNTKLYTFFTHFNFDENRDQNYLGLGIQYEF